MSLPFSAYIPLTPDAAAVVAALNAAVANLVTELQDYVAVPLVFEDGITVTGSPVTDAGYFAGLTWDSVPTAWLTDPANMDAYVATIPAELGLREVVTTRYGYDLVMLGLAPEAGAPPPAPPVLEFNSALLQPATFDSTISIATPAISGVVNQFWPTQLMGTFTGNNDYVRTTIRHRITVSQVGGFNAGQTLTLNILVWNDTNPSTIVNNVPAWSRSVIPLQTGATLQVIDILSVDVSTAAGDGVRVTATASLGIAIGALESPLVVTLAGIPAIHGERLQ